MKALDPAICALISAAARSDLTTDQWRAGKGAIMSLATANADLLAEVERMNAVLKKFADPKSWATDRGEEGWEYFWNDHGTPIDVAQAALTPPATKPKCTCNVHTATICESCKQLLIKKPETPATSDAELSGPLAIPDNDGAVNTPATPDAGEEVRGWEETTYDWAIIQVGNDYYYRNTSLDRWGKCVNPLSNSRLNRPQMDASTLARELASLKAWLAKGGK